MLKTLVRKQLKEVGAFIYYNSKKGERRSTKGIMAYSLLLLVIYGCVGNIFFKGSFWIGKTLYQVHLEWLYWVMVGLASIAFGIFGSIFNTYSTVYMAKDNELLLAMPIRKRDLLLARLLGVYVLGTFFAALVYVPAMAAALHYGGFTIKALLGELIMLVAISFVVLSLSALLGWGVALVSVHLRNKSFVTVIVSLLFIGVYYYAYFKASSVITTMLDNVDKIATNIRSKGFLIYHMGRAATGDLMSILVQVAFVAFFSSLVYWLLWNNFTKILTMKKGEKRTKVKKIVGVQKSVDQALLHKEALRFTKSSSYMLNCGMGSLMTIVAGVAILIKQDEIVPLLVKMGVHGELVTAVAIAGVCMIATMNDITAPSISMEGKNLWIVQSMPVIPWQVMKAKIKLHVYITCPPVIFCGCCVGYVLQMKPASFIGMLVMALVFVVFTATNGLIIGLLMPNLNWTNETVALKQSLGVMIALFGNWVLVAGIGVVAYWLRHRIRLEVYMIIVFIVIVAACGGMFAWLKKFGSKIFARL